MQYKIVFFARKKLLQLKCPKCSEWQFESDRCCECDFDLLSERVLEKQPTEYRVEVLTWRDRISDDLKRNVFERDEFICQYCGVHCYESWVRNKKAVTVDHQMPVSSGGDNSIDNLTTCCAECNGIKSNKRFKTFEEAREYIKQQREL